VIWAGEEVPEGGIRVVVPDPAPDAPLPAGWTMHKDSDGDAYYHHKETNESVYEHPTKPPKLKLRVGGEWGDALRKVKAEVLGYVGPAYTVALVAPELPEGQASLEVELHALCDGAADYEGIAQWTVRPKPPPTAAELAALLGAAAEADVAAAADA
jgi:hypothetical protein